MGRAQTGWKPRRGLCTSGPPAGFGKKLAEPLRPEEQRSSFCGRITGDLCAWERDREVYDSVRSGALHFVRPRQRGVCPFAKLTHGGAADLQNECH